MALRVSEIEVGGQRIRFGNLTLRAQREFHEALDALEKLDPKKKGVPLQHATKAVVFAAIQRADQAYTLEDLEKLDGDDLGALFEAVMEWTGRGREKPADPPPSP